LAAPKLTFLDEPTTGVDPVARRSLFDLLRKLKDSSVVLTTHRMDEAEALCDKIAIQVNGKFVCYGSPQHLKEKYGQGYKVDIKILQEMPTSALDTLIPTVLPFMERVGDKNEEGIVEFKIMAHDFSLA
jgi:ATP-binding cassette subfamily A (ABC1) protein 3